MDDHCGTYVFEEALITGEVAMGRDGVQSFGMVETERERY
jgi:hypothetical protein